jgi:hypothetical protein
MRYGTTMAAANLRLAARLSDIIATSNYMKTLQTIIKFVVTFSCLTLFTKCMSSFATDEQIEQKAIYLANHIDNNSLRLLRKFDYGARGEDTFWLRVSADTNLYGCTYKFENDTAKLSIWRPLNFIQDFSTIFKFDTSIYSHYSFLKVHDKIVKMELDSSMGNTLIKDTSVTIEHFFPYKDPFATFSELASIKNKYDLIGTSYRSDIGDFLTFWLSPKYKLEYLPDTLKMNQRSKKYWLNEFSKGKLIKQHWSLINVYKE